nr:pyridoxal phosphate-dependent aminotransferase [uncultured Oscillibacter sp.]
MSFVSEKSKNTPRSVIREMFAMQTGMENVVSFALGEPDFTAPQHVIDATVASFQRGETHYTPNAGIPALREAVAKSYQERGLDYSPNEIIIGAGAISVLCLACTAILDIGDEVLLPDPGWANYKGLMMQVGAVPVPVKVKEENGFMYDIDDLRAAITPKTKMLLLNSPSNPTGGVASAENLKAIAELVKEKDLYVLTDEIYRELLWDDEPYTSIASFPGMKERTVVVDGFSKKYAMTGFRLAWGAAPEEVIVTMTKLLENVLSSVNEGVQWGGVAALTGSQEPVEEMKKQYRRRREIIVEGLNSIKNVSCMSPKGAFYAFANISRTGLKSRDFAIRLLQEKHVVVVPGTGFGEGGEGFVRLSYATSEENIVEGLKRIKEFVESL